MRRSARWAGLALAAVVPSMAAAAEPAAQAAGAATFERLKRLAGTWEGHVMTPDGPPGSVVFELTSGGTALRERMFPGTPHEMMNVYFLDGDELVVTHYCHGNQPRFRMTRGGGGETAEVVFDFAGGTNIDPARTAHMHAARLRLLGPDRLEEEWDSWQDGAKTDTRKFFLTRRK